MHKEDLPNVNNRKNIAVVPASNTEMHNAFVQAVQDAGGELAPVEKAAALIWADAEDSSPYPEIIAKAPYVQWVQLPYAGVENFSEYLDNDHIWTCGKGVYADPVAEYIIGALLLGLRDFYKFVPADSWQTRTGRNLLGANITVLGGGGITESLIRLLQPWKCKVTVVRRSAASFSGAIRTVTLSSVVDAVVETDAVVLSLALTNETRHVVDEKLLDAMSTNAWLINVARGGHVDHKALADALRSGSIAGAVLDVTDPEPLPDDSELWGLPNCIITPHTGNTAEMGLPLITRRVKENVSRWINGKPMLGLVDVLHGY